MEALVILFGLLMLLCPLAMGAMMLLMWRGHRGSSRGRDANDAQ
jgi:hypothetical protein